MARRLDNIINTLQGLIDESIVPKSEDESEDELSDSWSVDVSVEGEDFPDK